jgi:hypothetical protein
MFKGNNVVGESLSENSEESTVLKVKEQSSGKDLINSSGLKRKITMKTKMSDHFKLN